MKRLLMLSAAGVIVVAAVAALAGCGGGGYGGGGSTASAPPAMNAATVSTRAIGDKGTVLVDSAGKALYATDQETAAKMVLCTTGCTSFWKPLTVSGGAPSGDPVSGKLGVVRRPDGSRQVTVNGKLLYSFTGDQPGEVSGDGFRDAFGGQAFTWHVVHPAGSTGSSGTGQTSSGPLGY